MQKLDTVKKPTLVSPCFTFNVKKMLKKSLFQTPHPTAFSGCFMIEVVLFLQQYTRILYKTKINRLT